MPKTVILYGLNTVLLLGVIATLVYVLVSDDDDDGEIQEVLRAQSFELVDDQGALRGIMSLIDGSRPNLALTDEAGAFRAWLLLGEDGSPNLVLSDSPRIVLIDGQGQIRAVNRLQSGSPILSMRDASGNIRTVMQLAGDGTPILEFYGAEGQLLGASP